jgi:hypothetical protein
VLASNATGTSPRWALLISKTPTSTQVLQPSGPMLGCLTSKRSVFCCMRHVKAIFSTSWARPTLRQKHHQVYERRDFSKIGGTLQQWKSFICPNQHLYRSSSPLYTLSGVVVIGPSSYQIDLDAQVKRLLSAKWSLGVFYPSIGGRTIKYSDADDAINKYGTRAAQPCV